MAKAQLKLTVETTGTLNELKDALGNAVDHIMNNGLITGETPDEIISYDYQVITNIGEDSDEQN